MKQLLVNSIPFCCLLLILSCSKQQEAGFRLLDPSESGIQFNNTIEENDSINVLSYMNIYTGAGVAVGDINNDGLSDVYFSGNMVSGRLYLNKGGLKFEDISEKSGLINSRWGTGATMVDINQDGWLDIYVCVSGSAKEPERANMLYINNGDLTFTEQAEAYGLADTRQSMQAAFFDYDKDQDLDMYLLVNPAAYENRVNISQPRKLNGESPSNDRLYRNEGNGKFVDVTLESGILTEGYGLGIGISDINNDTWPDIYVSNDFIGNDILYINQGDGTFKNQINEYINHTSYAGMGNDVADIDNNGKPDIMVLDMRPEDNKRQKLIISSTGYDRFQMMLDAGYDPQYSRNTLQLNLGEGEFSEIGFLAGVSSTDWSWSALLADYDNDGYRDLYVTNGFLRDLGNLDYIHYQNIYDNPLGDPETKIKNKLESIRDLPTANLVNYVYKNKGNLTFENESTNWGINMPSCSNGAAYADLDNDGDLDLLVNNVSQPAFLYENIKAQDASNNYLRIRLKGRKGNLQGIGSLVKITTDTLAQYYEQFLSRGYESSVDPLIHFGLGKYKKADKVEVWWPDGGYQAIGDVPSNGLLVIDQEESVPAGPITAFAEHAPLFSDSTDSLGIDFRHKEDIMVDFKLQPILPHMHSRFGPGIAVADVNNDSLEDFFVGGASGQSGRLYLQDSSGAFRAAQWTDEPKYEDLGSLFFDADGDGDPDLYVVSGGVFLDNKPEIYQDRLYINDGQGNFTKQEGIPPITASGSTVTAADFDKDGDLDLFVGGRVAPGAYPMPSKSYLLENISEKNSGRAKFVDISSSVPGWDKLTMVSSALWTDYDNDGWPDLIAAGEFMPVTIFQNKGGKLAGREENTTGLAESHGWWNSIAGGDFDNDGDIDYLLGNLGLNSKYSASVESPLCIFAKDYDKDGKVDPVMCYFIGDKNYLAHSRDEIIGQINAMRSRFKTYESYSDVTFEDAFLPEEINDAYIVKSETFESAYLENLGDGTFKTRPLPKDCQMGPIEGILVDDFDGDGKLDALLTGNSYTTEVSTGRYDAIKGIVLKGNGMGGFSVMPLSGSGLLNDRDASGLAMVGKAKGGSYAVLANNDGPLRVFELNAQKKKGQRIFADPNTIRAEIIYKNGKHRMEEFYFGSGYLSQSSRSISLNNQIQEILLHAADGTIKTVYHDE
jgi:hypothetical protein